MADRKVRRVRGLQDLRTGLTSQVRSVPQSPGRGLVEAYMALNRMQLLDNQLRAVHKRKHRAEEAVRRLTRCWGDTRLKDLIEEGVAGSTSTADDTGPRARERAQNRRKPLFATLKLRY